MTIQVCTREEWLAVYDAGHAPLDLSIDYKTLANRCETMQCRIEGLESAASYSTIEACDFYLTWLATRYPLEQLTGDDIWDCGEAYKAVVRRRDYLMSRETVQA